jgi:hypothetical protein
MIAAPAARNGRTREPQNTRAAFVTGRCSGEHRFQLILRLHDSGNQGPHWSAPRIGDPRDSGIGLIKRSRWRTYPDTLRPPSSGCRPQERHVRQRSQRYDRIELASRPQRSRPRTRPERLPPGAPAVAISGWSDGALALRRRCFPCRDRCESKMDRTDGRGPILAGYSPQSVAGRFRYSEPRFARDAESERLRHVAVSGPSAKCVASAAFAPRSCLGEGIRFGFLRESGFSPGRSPLPRSEGDLTWAFE